MITSKCAIGLVNAGRGAYHQAAAAIKSAKNGFKALQARFKRGRSRAKFIAVTGSSGKTTTVGLLAHILSADFKVRTQVERNGFFNAIKTLRNLKREDQFVVL
jgi:UDP-N-acetylmuramoyl-tripeptide--D-alanyl-D-alanine ligase